jgi:hypothetical protein
MLFSGKIQEIQSTVNANALEIEALLLRVEELRAQNLSLENHLQQLGSAEAAAESAIEQVRTALTMIYHISASEIDTFKAAIDSLFDSPRAELPASVDPEPEPPAPTKTERVIDTLVTDEATIDVTASPLTDLIQEITEDLIDIDGDDGQNFATPETNGNGHAPIADVKQLLEVKTIVQLRKLLRARNLSDKGNKPQLIDRLLSADITASDL